LPTIKLDTLPLEAVIDAIRSGISLVQPDVVYVNHCGDVHSDHRIIFEAAMSALKPFNSPQHGVKRLLSYEVLSSTDAMPPSQSRSFLPNVFCDITKFIDRKIEIMSNYKTEVQQYPLPRSLDTIRALARYRGASIGCEYAEAFMLLREVQ
jgi:LmbE family N-acetylglucosaminyl deacetylase